MIRWKLFGALVGSWLLILLSACGPALISLGIVDLSRSNDSDVTLPVGGTLSYAPVQQTAGSKAEDGSRLPVLVFPDIDGVLLQVAPVDSGDPEEDSRPPDFSLDARTGSVSFTVPDEPREYDIRLRYSVVGKDDEVILSISILPQSPVGLTYPSSPCTAPPCSSVTLVRSYLVQGVLQQPLRPTTANPVSGPVDDYTISPTLPRGLDFDETTGVIRGIPLEDSDPVDYTIVASNATGSDRFELTLDVVPPRASFAFLLNEDSGSLNRSSISLLRVGAEDEELIHLGYEQAPPNLQDVVVHPESDRPFVYVAGYAPTSGLGILTGYRYDADAQLVRLDDSLEEVQFPPGDELELAIEPATTPDRPDLLYVLSRELDGVSPSWVSVFALRKASGDDFEEGDPVFLARRELEPSRQPRFLVLNPRIAGEFFFLETVADSQRTRVVRYRFDETMRSIEEVPNEDEFAPSDGRFLVGQPLIPVDANDSPPDDALGRLLFLVTGDGSELGEGILTYQIDADGSPVLFNFTPIEGTPLAVSAEPRGSALVMLVERSGSRFIENWIVDLGSGGFVRSGSDEVPGLSPAADARFDLTPSRSSRHLFLLDQGADQVLHFRRETDGGLALLNRTVTRHTPRRLSFAARERKGGLALALLTARRAEIQGDYVTWNPSPHSPCRLRLPRQSCRSSPFFGSRSAPKPCQPG